MACFAITKTFINFALQTNFTLMDYIFKTEMEVRDYECDIEGIVNNANYVHYLEHTRHLFLRSRNVSFAELHNQGTDVVVSRLDVRYKVPLRCDDEFVSCINVEKKGARFVFHQDIYRKSDMKLSISAIVEIVSLVNGRLVAVSAYDELLAEDLKTNTPS